MRIIRFLLVSFFVFGILSIVVAVVARELWLIYGVSTVRTDLQQMRRIDREPGQYVRECQQKGAEIAPDIIGSIQLRFLSNTEYLIEVVCSDFQLDPILVKRNQLPPFIQKQPGQPGILWGNEPSGVILETFGRRRAVVVEAEEMFFETPRSTTVLGTGPVTTCAGVGYECCAAESTAGEGQVYSAVTDCPRTCYSSCQQIPVVLSFTSDPFFDPTSRRLELRLGQEVTFRYVVSGITDAPSVTIEYGDGAIDTATGDSGMFTHRYQCAQQTCNYTAQLRVDDNGLQSVDLPVSQIRITTTSVR